MSRTSFYVVLTIASLIFYILYFTIPIYKDLHRNNALFQFLRTPDVEHPKSFSKMIEELSLDVLKDASLKNDTQQITSFTEDLISKLSYFLALEPTIPINSTCTPPDISPLSFNISCKDPRYETGLNGRPRSTPIKIGMLIQLGFDVDVLEIYLNELADVVDKFFIIESTKTHFRTLRKPLMWDMVKSQPRFSKFKKKIVHFVVDDSQSAWVNVLVTSSHNDTDDSSKKDKTWGMESLQEFLRWEKFEEWNNAHQFFSDNDLLGFGDSDEIPNRNMVHLLRYCQLKIGTLDFGIWFPFGNIHQAFKTDFPVHGHEFTLGDPTFWTLKDARDSALREVFPSRRRGKSMNFLLGGIHMTHYGYLPFQLVKRVTATETGLLDPSSIQRYQQQIREGNLRELELEMASVSSANIDRIYNLSDIVPKSDLEMITILPWFYNCNRRRYPVWEGNHDLRLDLFE